MLLFALLLFVVGNVVGVHEIIVIGAGASGLAAARALTDAGHFKVTILEARPNRYGGRIWTNTESFQSPAGRGIDMGASFIHDGNEDNAIVKLHRKFNLPMIDADYTGLLVVRENDSMPYSETRVEAASEKVSKVFEAVNNVSLSLEADISVYAALTLINQYELIEDPLSQTFVAEQEFFFGDTIDILSTKHLYDGYQEADITTASEKIPGLGYIKMLDKIVQNSPTDTPLNILLGQEVVEVNVKEDKRVIVTCRNGNTYQAEAVIVTLPLGVLKANDVKFTPGLSTEKKGAIKRVGFGTVNKLMLEFSQRFWPNDTHHITVATEDSADRGKFSFLSSFQAIVDKPVIVTYAVSHFGEQSEMLSNNQLKDIALRRLRTAFGAALDGVAVVNISRSRWKSDRFSRGSYSYPALGIKQGDWDTLGKADPPLFFAGEHTQAGQYGTVLSAIETGRKAATEVDTYLISGNAASADVSSSFLILPSLFFEIFRYFL